MPRHFTFLNDYFGLSNHVRIANTIASENLGSLRNLAEVLAVPFTPNAPDGDQLFSSVTSKITQAQPRFDRATKRKNAPVYKRA